MHMTTNEIFLIAMVIIFTAPYLIWRLGRTDYWAPLIVVQIIMGVILGPGILGAIYPDYYEFVFTPPIIQSLNGIASWAVMIFVWIAGIELDLKKAWESKKESGITAGFALGTPLVFGCTAAAGLLIFSDGWMGEKAATWQFILGVGMGCAVTALPILILLMEKMDVLRQPIGQRILRYASLDDVAIWAVLALILLDWDRVGRQALFLGSFIVLSYLFRKLMIRISESDRWYSSFIWLSVISLAADWAGLHFMVGAFLAGVVMDRDWFNHDDMDKLRYFVVLIIMPVFFLSTGLRTNWDVGATEGFVVAGLLLLAQLAGKLAGVHAAGRILNWKKGEASLVGWLLQTKGLIEIVFATVLLDKEIITREMFTALLLMAVASTMLTAPVVAPKLKKVKEQIFRPKQLHLD